MDKEPPGSESGNSRYSLQGTGPDFLMEGFNSLSVEFVYYNDALLGELAEYWDED